MSNRLRLPRERRLRELCLFAAVLIATGCGGAHRLAPLTLASSALPITWLSPLEDRDARAMARWRVAVGSPLIARGAPPAATTGFDALTVVSWNVALDGGDVVRLVREVRSRAPERPIVLLLQEVFRSGDDVPVSVDGEYASHLGSSRQEREIDDIARRLGFSLYYVPSMRNGAPGRHVEDRGNAVLSSLPLDDFAAIELPFERQRRVAAAARIGGRRSTGEAWSIKVVSVHLDNLVGLRNGWIATEYGRARQARGLNESLSDDEPTVLGGDFNTWFGFSDQAYIETALAFPQTEIGDTRTTFRGLLRLDHVFYRVAPGWTAEVVRADSSFGSDHYPLITTITF